MDLASTRVTRHLYDIYLRATSLSSRAAQLRCSRTRRATLRSLLSSRLSLPSNQSNACAHSTRWSLLSVSRAPRGLYGLCHAGIYRWFPVPVSLAACHRPQAMQLVAWSATLLSCRRPPPPRRSDRPAAQDCAFRGPAIISRGGSMLAAWRWSSGVRDIIVVVSQHTREAGWRLPPHPDHILRTIRRLRCLVSKRAGTAQSAYGANVCGQGQGGEARSRLNLSIRWSRPTRPIAL